jgi:glycosyltransferase involved in cell wall biosynthesis
MHSIGILVVTRNHENFIGACLSSVLNEFPSYAELVVVDSGSTDSTGRQARALLDASQHGSVVSLPAVPTCQTAIVGMRRMSSDYVCVLSGDDFLLPGYFRWVREMLSAASGPVCLNSALRVVSDGPRANEVIRSKWIGIPRLDRLQLFVRNAGRGPGMVVPRVLAADVLAGHDSSSIEDLVLWVGLVEKVRMIPGRAPLVAYRVHQLSQSSLHSNQYAWSLGYGAGLNQNRAKNWLEMVLAKWGCRRSRGPLTPEQKAHFDAGHLNASSNGC